LFCLFKLLYQLMEVQIRQPAIDFGYNDFQYWIAFDGWEASSPPVFSGLRVTGSLVLYVCFVDRCLSFCTFSFGHCVFCFSLIYGFWSVPDLGQMRPCASYVMRPLSCALKEVDPVGLHRQSGIHAQEI
jgi:hypothetical protein